MGIDEISLLLVRVLVSLRRIRVIAMPLFLAMAICQTVILIGSTVSSSASAATRARGVSSPPLLQLLAAKEAVDSASSVTVSGSVQDVVSTFEVHLHLFANGSSEGTIVVKRQTASIVIVGNWFYLRGSAGFWTNVFGQAPSNSLHLSDEWFALSRSSISGLGANVSLSHLRRSFDLPAVTKITAVETASAGKPVIAVHIGASGLLTIEAKAPNLPIAFDGSNDGNLLHIAFSRWNSGKAPTVPKGLIIYPAG